MPLCSRMCLIYSKRSLRRSYHVPIVLLRPLPLTKHFRFRFCTRHHIVLGFLLRLNQGAQATKEFDCFRVS